jgi:hypothetical protein
VQRQRQRQGQRGAAASSGVQRVAWDSGWGWMRERRSLADLWPSCPWQVLEACRDASVSPQLRTARPARAPASQGSTAPRAARQHGVHGVSERTSQGRALLLLLLIRLREHTRFTPPWRPKGLLLASAHAMSALPSSRPHPSSIIHCPSVVSPTQALLAHPVLPCFVSRGTRQGWDGGWLGSWMAETGN